MNGIACLSWIAVREGLGDQKRLVIDTGGGRREVELDIDPASGELAAATVDMGPATFEPAGIPLDAPSAFDLEVTFHGVTYHGDAAGMGNPHLVLLVDDPETTRVYARLHSGNAAVRYCRVHAPVDTVAGIDHASPTQDEIILLGRRH